MRYSLSRKEIIKNKKIFEQLFSDGKTVASGSRIIRARYLILFQKSDVPVKIAIGVSKRVGNAVWRNRVKRLMRESYRLQKHSLLSACIEKQVSLFVLFSPISLNQKKNKDVSLNLIKPRMYDILSKLEASVRRCK